MLHEHVYENITILETFIVLVLEKQNELKQSLETVTNYNNHRKEKNYLFLL